MMKASKFIERKNETAQIILSLQDEALLNRVYAILMEEQLSPEVLAGIDRGLADSKAGRMTPIEDFLEEIKDLCNTGSMFPKQPRQSTV